MPEFIQGRLIEAEGTVHSSIQKLSGIARKRACRAQACRKEGGVEVVKRKISAGTGLRTLHQMCEPSRRAGWKMLMNQTT